MPNYMSLSKIGDEQTDAHDGSVLGGPGLVATVMVFYPVPLFLNIERL